MIFDPEVWDVLLIAAAAYVAVTSLVRMMRSYRSALIIQMRTLFLKRRMGKSSKPAPKSTDASNV